MKKLITILLILNTFITTAADHKCSRVIRAVNTDQEDMAIGTTLYKYNLAPKDVLSINLTDYLSWKEKQVQCLANIRHTAVVNIQYIKEENKQSQICDLQVDVNRFDNFLLTPSETVYSFSNKTITCRKETIIELTDRVSCQSQPCVQTTAQKVYRDYKDNCTCKSIWDYPTFTDHSDDYKDFYNLSKFFKTN
jgi:hypothetical protein